MLSVPVPPPAHDPPIERQVAALSRAFRQAHLQNRKLACLYQQSRHRSQQVVLANARFSQDLRFLRDYCLWLETHLSASPHKASEDLLSRKETADSIFLAYTASSEVLPEAALGAEAESLGRQ